MDSIFKTVIFLSIFEKSEKLYILLFSKNSFLFVFLFLFFFVACKTIFQANKLMFLDIVFMYKGGSCCTATCTITSRHWKLLYKW